MRSKPAKEPGLPDQPDRAGMRERRKQSTMTVRALQRQRGVASVEAAAFWSPESSFRLLSVQISSLPSTGFRALQSLMNLLAVDIGPQGCEAAPVARAVSALDDFQQKFLTDFEIWFSPSARRSEDMRGMIIVIGEHHYDPEILGLVKRVMLGFRQSRGDRFFIESGDPQLCVERVLKYAMEVRDCRLLEKDTPAYSKLAGKRDESLRTLSLCVDYLKTHVPAAREGVNAKNIAAYIQFIQRYASQLPLPAISGYNTLLQVANEAIALSEKAIQDLLPERDDQMAGKVRSERSLSARNYVVVGAHHVPGMYERLGNLPCIVMVPRQMVAKSPVFAPRGAFRQEL